VPLANSKRRENHEHVFNRDSPLLANDRTAGGAWQRSCELTNRTQREENGSLTKAAQMLELTAPQSSARSLPALNLQRG
jgi:hypothetical protein